MITHPTSIHPSVPKDFQPFDTPRLFKRGGDQMPSKQPVFRNHSGRLPSESVAGWSDEKCMKGGSSNQSNKKQQQRLAQSLTNVIRTCRKYPQIRTTVIRGRAWPKRRFTLYVVSKCVTPPSKWILFSTVSPRQKICSGGRSMESASASWSQKVKIEVFKVNQY